MASIESIQNHEAQVHQAQMMQAFNVYRTPALREVLDQPRTFAFVDGVVVSSVANIVSADPCGVVLRVDRTQIAALERNAMLLIESPLHGSTYRGKVDGIDRRRHYASVSHLETFDTYSERRSHSRASPGFAMLAKVLLQDTEISGRVVDISAQALAADFDPGAVGLISPEEDLELEVWGNQEKENRLHDFVITARMTRTTDVERDGAIACRAVFELDPYRALERSLRRYVAKRQREILIELCMSSDDEKALRILT